VLAASSPNDGTHTVVAPNAVFAAAQLRIRSVEAPCFYAESGVFNVQ